MTTRVFSGGMADLAGSKVGSLRVGDLVSRNPIKWATTCEICGSHSSAAHEKLISGAAGRCLNSGCGKEKLREIISDTPQKAGKREAAEQHDRDREREETEAAEVAALEAQATEAHRKIRSLVKERIEKIADDEVFLDPETVGLRMEMAEAREYNREQAAIFVENNPSYYPCPANLEKITGYLSRNGIQIASHLTLAKAFERLRDFGLLEERPISEPEVKSAERLSYTPTPAPRIEEISKPDRASMFIGIDPLTGMERSFSPKEVDSMTSAEYRKSFKVGNIADILVRR
jgi:hypothetical protein